MFRDIIFKVIMKKTLIYIVITIYCLLFWYCLIKWFMFNILPILKEYFYTLF